MSVIGILRQFRTESAPYSFCILRMSCIYTFVGFHFGGDAASESPAQQNVTGAAIAARATRIAIAPEPWPNEEGESFR